MVKSDDRYIIAQGVGVITAMHGHVGGGDSDAATEEPAGPEYQCELARSVPAVPPAVSGGDGAGVAQHRRTTD